MALLLEGDVQAGIAELERTIRLEPDWPEPLNELAWIRATHPDPGFRNGVEALHLARTACELTKQSVPRFLGTLDAALAEAGRFEEAIAAVKNTQAVANQAQDAAVADAALRRLELYRQGKPFRGR